MDTITNPLLESMSMIAQNAIKDLQYDNTIRCTVVDASRAKEGVYKVSNGTAIFTAYSTENYNKNTEVYVTIPQGDMTNDKVIVGKVVKDKNEPYVYASPFETYIDATGNLIPIAEANEGYGLLTNGKQTTLLVWSKDYTKTPLVGYTRLGLAADFQSWLFEQECVAGNYGLQLVVNYQDKDTSTEELVAINYLDTLDMVGNPYYFDSFFWQEKVFDISTLKKITKISLYFYQKQNFYDINGEKVPSNLVQSDDNFDEFGEELPPNLFTRNFNLSLGYDANEIEGDVVQINTLYNPTYSADRTNEDNKKVLSLLWIRQNERGERYKVVNAAPFTNNDYKTRWYKYNIASESDGYGGMCWECIYDSDDDSNKIKVEIDFVPQVKKATEQIKAVAIYGKIEYVLAAGLTEEEFKKSKSSYFVYSEEKYIQCDNSSQYSSEISYYTATDNRVITESNVLTLTNEQEVISEATLEALNALTIVCEDQVNANNGTWKTTKGNYFLYGDNNQLKDSNQRNIKRRFSLLFRIKETDVTNELDVNSIVWSYPKTSSSTMIVNPQINTKDKLSMEYYISNSISNTKLQENTVTCSVVYKGNTYTASKTLSFGNVSYMGSTCNFDVDFENGIEALYLCPNNEKGQGGQDLSYTLKVSLYNEVGEEQPVTAYDIGVTWWCSGASQLLGQVKVENNKILLSTLGSQFYKKNNALIKNGSTVPLKESEYIYILDVSIINWKNESSDTSYTLTKHIPIAIRLDSKYVNLIGQKEIRYSYDGTPQVIQKQPYGLQVLAEDGITWTKATETIAWSIIGKHSNEKYKVTPPSLDKGKLNPYAFWETYDTGDDSFYAVAAKDTNGQFLWVQPIPIYQTPYFSSIIDSWKSGEIDLGDTGDGTIKSPRIAAGTKNSKNQFSGVILGDWEKQIGTEDKKVAKTGLYGFQEGKASFGFNEDGTAFIGKSGGAQILFEGDEGTISSASYNAGESGLKLDLAKGQIDATDFELMAYGFKVENGTITDEIDYNKRIKLSTRPGTTFDDTGKLILDYNEYAKPFEIGSNFSVDWEGNMKATDGEFSGNINAQSGQIGNWYISTGNEKRLQSLGGAVYLDPSGTIYGSAIKTGNSDKAPSFHVNSSGALGIGRKSGASGDTINEANYNFVVYNNGEVKITGDGSISFVDEAIKGVKDELTDAKEEIGDDITEILEDISTIEGDISTIEGDISTAKGNITTLSISLQTARTTLANNIQKLATGTYTGFTDLDGVWHPAGSTFINGNTIYAPQIIGGSIEGAAFKITGVSWGSGYTASALNFFDPVLKVYQGDITYDNTGAGTEQEATYRLWVRSATALKLQSGSKGISLEALYGKIHMMSDTHFYDTVGFGKKVTFESTVDMTNATVTGFYAKFA